MTNPAPSFGRRRSPPSNESMPATPERDRQIYEAIAADAFRHSAQDDEMAVRVPNSVGAGILTGAVIGVAELAIRLHDSASPGLHLGPLVVDLGPSTVPLALSVTLWSGGRAGFMSAFVVHGLLRRLGRTAFVDYGVAGALVGLAMTALLHMLGMSDGNWVAETVLGAAAGALYRLFAGALQAT